MSGLVVVMKAVVVVIGDDVVLPEIVVLVPIVVVVLGAVVETKQHPGLRTDGSHESQFAVELGPCRILNKYSESRNSSNSWATLAAVAQLWTHT